MKIDFLFVDEFDKELKKLSRRKCRTLIDDLETLKSAIRVKIPENVKTKQINNLGESVKIPIYKVRRFRCKQIKKRI